jgi:hypothetical protein
LFRHRFRTLHEVVVVVGFGLSACADAEPVPAADVTADTSRLDTTPWIYAPDDVSEEPALATATLQQAIDTAVSVALELDTSPIAALHDLLLPPPPIGEGDLSGCPAYLTYDYGNAVAFFWQGECTGENGHTYSGQGVVAVYTNFTNEVGTFSGSTVQLSGRITAPDGTFLEGSGAAGFFAGGNAQLAARSNTLNGAWRAGGPRAPVSPWLDGTREPSLEVASWTFLPTGGRNLTLKGGLSFSADSPLPAGVSALVFEDFTARAILAGASCEQEPGGMASVRGDDGTWYDVLFDGPTDAAATTPAETCDGCGATWYRAREIDPVCVDGRNLLARLP